MTFPEKVKAKLWSSIAQMATCAWLFSKKPESDFSRKRKLDFENLMRLSIVMENGATSHELLKFFQYDINVPSHSAFIQQRGKLLPEAFQYLMREFNSHFPLGLYKGKYQLVAADGSGFNIARNPEDEDTFHPPSGKSKKGFNEIHATAIYDLIGRRYLDCEVQPGRKKDEFAAICNIIDRYSYGGHPIFIGDRGFASYNVFAHAMEKSMSFVIRAKDLNVMRMLGVTELPPQIDTSVSLILTRSNAKSKRKHPELAGQYRHVSSGVNFDFIRPKSADEYPMTLRIVRFMLDNGTYENIITNLPADEFPPDEIKAVYWMRWGIETSFRDLKHTIGATNFHSKKPEFIEMEIWARMIMFNLCAIITAHVVIAQNDTKHIYQVNYSMAIKICRRLIRLASGEKPPDVAGLIGKYTLPVRPGRTYERQHRYQSQPSFAYRFT
jgi:hypothetical protein